MAYISSSEDEFPDIEIIARRHKKKACKEPDGENEDTPRRSGSLKLAQTGLNKNNGKTPATTRRIRKLDQSQPVDRSLLKPWQGSERDREIGSNASSSRQPSWAQNGREEIKDAQSGNLLDRLPATTKRGECRVVSSGTVFDSPPKERKTTRRLITRGEKKALDSKSTQKVEIRAESSDESESETESYDENDDSLSDQDDGSDFLLGGDSDSDDLSMTPPSRSQSPSGPRRMQRRVLHPPNVTIKKEPTRTNPKMDDPITSPRKQPEKRNVPKVSTTKQLKAAPKGKLEDAFEKLKIFNEESEEEPATRDSKIQTTEPMTPRKNLTASPAKVPRIPMSPWKPEHKEFWDPEVNFAWIDKHSPPKKSTKGAATTRAHGGLLRARCRCSCRGRGWSRGVAARRVPGAVRDGDRCSRFVVHTGVPRVRPMDVSGYGMTRADYEDGYGHSRPGAVYSRLQ
ncbi:hypothetical protein NUW58_g2376 [Xylaria curta]|uniref:Uncharacterized protein n=1 Tax=Xylaria curta TaxID=42375 RepID=A0ACC1PH23_9PEZI|nr:hypothetical protein NUW58_g2376 [Xylaria curta]